MPTPTRDGYIFNGWFLGDTQITSSTQYTTIGDITLNADWTFSDPVTITADKTYVAYDFMLELGDDGESFYVNHGKITLTASGGGGEWIYSIVKSSSTKSGINANDYVTLSTTSATTGPVVVTHKYPEEKLSYYDFYYTIRATSVAYGTYAEIDITFNVSY